MSASHDIHEPRPEFMSHLEWQIASAARREARFAEPVSRRRTGLPSAVVIVAALIVGAAGGVASGQVQDSARRQAITQSLQAELQLAQTRLTLAQSEYEDARKRFALGTAGRDAVTHAELQVRAMEVAMQRLQMDITEVQATSASPRNNLDAPLVGQRDFVKERLMLDLSLAEQQLLAAERALGDVSAQVKVGLATRAALLSAESDVLAARGRMQLLQRTVQLRQEHLRGALTIAEVTLAQRREELMLALRRAEGDLRAAQEQLATLKRRADVGLADQLEAKRAELVVLEQQIALQRLHTELQALQRGK